MRHASNFIRSAAQDYRYTTNGDIPIEMLHEQQRLTTVLHDWRRCYTSVWTSVTNISDGDALLRVHYHTTKTMLYGCLHAHETIYDLYTEDFREIVRLAEDLNRNSDHVHRASFSAETRIVYPLYWTAKRCRDGKVRRAALAQLRRCSREGVWIPDAHFAVAQRVMEIEEAALNGCIPSCRDVMEWWRVHCVGLNVDKATRTVKMVYQRLLNGLDGEWNTDCETLSY